MHAGDTAWGLGSAALVLFMTPGLALFYGGMVRSKNVLSIMGQSFFVTGIVTVLWALIGFSLAFSRDAGGGLIGNLGFFGLKGLGHGLPGYAHLVVSPEAVMIFQMMFAIITAALLIGGAADRMRFRGFAVFITLWLLFVYSPIAHWVFSPVGWLAHLGVLDFAGGTVVEIQRGPGRGRQVGHLIRFVGQPGEIVPGQLIAAEWRFAELRRGSTPRGRIEIGKVTRRLSDRGAAGGRQR